MGINFSLCGLCDVAPSIVTDDPFLKTVAAKEGIKKAGSLGVIRLDYNYPPAPGDIDHPGSFEYNVYYRAVPGLSFTMVMNWQTQKTKAVEDAIIEAVKFLDVEKGVSGITGDCGFMMYIQDLIRNNTKKPVFMSSLAQLPAMTCAYGKAEMIAIFTANGKTLAPMRDLIRDECGVDTQAKRFVIVGCQDVPGFEAVAEGGKVPVAGVTVGMIAKARQVLKDNPTVRGFMMECTELPPYSDAIRQATGLPVWDAITSCNAFMAGVQDNPLFGLDGWHYEWDGKQEKYTFGANLNAGDYEKLRNSKTTDKAVTADTKGSDQIIQHKGPTKAKAGSLGVLRLDYNYPPAKGDIDHPGSFEYDVFYRAVPGLSFETCMNWDTMKTPEVEANVLAGIKYLVEEKGVSGITGDCGFMMFLQQVCRRSTNIPIFMSSLAQLPSITAAYAKGELIAIFTANSKTLEPMRDLIRDECGVDTQQKRFIIVGCEDVPGFEAVAAGDRVNLAKVTPGMVAKAKEVIAAHPTLRGFMFECTELPPYSDAVRHATGLPVWDAITSCNAFIAGVQDNPRFGLQGWQEEWDGVQDKYKLGQNLSEEDRAKLVNA